MEGKARRKGERRVEEEAMKRPRDKKKQGEGGRRNDGREMDKKGEGTRRKGEGRN